MNGFIGVKVPRHLPDIEDSVRCRHEFFNIYKIVKCTPSRKIIYDGNQIFVSES